MAVPEVVANQQPNAVVLPKEVLDELPKSIVEANEKYQTTESESSNSLFSGGRFAVPSDRSLVGLVGAFEVPIEADLRGDFSEGVAKIKTDDPELVQSINAINLAEAVKASLGFSREVLVASRRADQAKAQTGQAKAFLLPSVLLTYKSGREISMPGAQIDANTNKPDPRNAHSRADAMLTIKQPLVDLPNWNDWKRREVIEDSRSESVRSSLGDTYLATVNAYLTLASSRLQVNMMKEYEAQLQELFRYIEKRAGAGAASNSDKERVRARSLNAKSSRIEQEAAHAAAGVELVRLINLSPSSIRLPDLEEVGISIVPKSIDQAMSQAVEGNPDIRMLQAELKAAEIDQKVAFGRFFPRLDLEYQNSDTVHPGGQANSQNDQRLMLVMNWAMFNGGSDLKLGDEKAARYEELKYRLDDQRRRVLQNLTAQYATLEATRDRIVAGYRELESISAAAKAMSKRMVSGNQSLLDMLDVYDRFYQARTRLVTLHTQEMVAVAQIARLVQGTPNTANEVKEVDATKSVVPALVNVPIESDDKKIVEKNLVEQVETDLIAKEKPIEQVSVPPVKVLKEELVLPESQQSTSKKTNSLEVDSSLVVLQKLDEDAISLSDVAAKDQ